MNLTNIIDIINILLIITQGVVINKNTILLWLLDWCLHLLYFGLHNWSFCSKRFYHWFHLGRRPISLVRSPGVVMWLVVREVRAIRSGWRGVVWLADPRPCGFRLWLPTWGYWWLGHVMGSGQIISRCWSAALRTQILLSSGVNGIWVVWIMWCECVIWVTWVMCVM